MGCKKPKILWHFYNGYLIAICVAARASQLQAGFLVESDTVRAMQSRGNKDVTKLSLGNFLQQG